MTQPTDLPERPHAPPVRELGSASPMAYASPQVSGLCVMAPSFPEDNVLGLVLWSLAQ